MDSKRPHCQPAPPRSRQPALCRLAARLLALELLVLAPVAMAESGLSAAATGERTAARIDLFVKIPEVLSLRLLGEQTSLEVTREDIARGFIVAQVNMEVLSNARSGFQLHLRTDPRLATDGVVEGLDVPLRLTNADGTVRLTHHGLPDKSRRYALTVRMQLAPGARPGRYTQPVRLSLSA